MVFHALMPLLAFTFGRKHIVELGGGGKEVKLLEVCFYRKLGKMNQELKKQFARK